MEFLQYSDSLAKGYYDNYLMLDLGFYLEFGFGTLSSGLCSSGCYRNPSVAIVVTYNSFTLEFRAGYPAVLVGVALYITMEAGVASMPSFLCFDLVVGFVHGSCSSSSKENKGESGADGVDGKDLTAADTAFHQDDYCDGEELAKIDCVHVYHLDCIKEWIKLETSCPICKRDALAILT
ncbi:RING finger protein 24 [Datura stramonium]|uniref:RING-type E3 ubiquitin transferase n=1 Tax=Datura stramonium TaxID=4076 RepID=A0ABS8SQ74_DATST|nr:RING finger protein 24 [Datura stramonium]